MCASRMESLNWGRSCLEATHSGNNVYIHVRDDGAGIDTGKIKAKLISNRILSESAARELSDEQALEYIWHAGFSTAQEITDVSGRGVGMDVVQNRIRQLNGSIDSRIGARPRHALHHPTAAHSCHHQLPVGQVAWHCVLDADR